VQKTAQVRFFDPKLSLQQWSDGASTTKSIIELLIQFPQNGVV
jgi:hypothetical protein